MPESHQDELEPAPLGSRAIARLRRSVRLRTRLRAAWSRERPAPPRRPADFATWAARPARQRLGAFPDAWKGRDDVPLTEPSRVGVVLHVYYTEQLPELFGRLRCIPTEYDLWLTNASGEELEAPAELGRVRNVRVLEVENRGRDILPLLSLVNAGYLDPYELLLKVHTKRSAWRADHEALEGDGGTWRHDLLNAVLGDEADVTAILSAFAERPGLGLVTADGNLLDAGFWGGNDGSAAELLRRIELDVDRSRLRFAAGSIYWVRGFALQGLRSLNLGRDDFEPEEGQVNGTTAHALERVLGLLVEEAGLALVERSALESSDRLEGAIRYGGGAVAARARVVPFYLPQFHPIPENDRWWGKGFTEWTNVTAARPVYEGHHQPLLPRDLGFYDLRLDEIRSAQHTLADASGIAGFMYYHYWFAGKRLLGAPIEALVRSDLPQPFCVMWANENWTRRWDGEDSDVLISQDEGASPDLFIDDILPLLADERYMTIHGRKIVAVYKPGQISGLAGVVSSWRSRARAAGVGELFLVAVDFGGERGLDDPRASGMDGSLGFPPHNHLWEKPGGLEGVDPRFRGSVLSYAALVDDAGRRLGSETDGPSFPGVMVAFDNTPRRQWSPHIWFGSNPYTFRRWLAAVVESLAKRPPDERLVFVNAWNEWAEGAVLEPSDRFGRTFLLAIRDVVRG